MKKGIIKLNSFKKIAKRLLGIGGKPRIRITEDSRLNVYICKSCPEHLITVDIDDGVTPFRIGCQKCQGDMTSRFYPPGLYPYKNKVTHGWVYDPDYPCLGMIEIEPY